MSDLSPKPDPFTEEPQLRPGGPDALPRDPDGSGLPRDLDPDSNPSVNDELPDEITEPDDKEQAPSGKADEEAGTTEETPSAGQQAEDGSPEPPA
jgi:hypothetical protein